MAALGSLAAISLAGAPPKDGESIKVNKRPSHSDITAKKSKHVSKPREERKVQEKPVVTVKKRSLIQNATLLTSGKNWTILPKGSVIYIPEKLKTKIVKTPKGELVDWKTFLRLNRGWVYVHSISMKQAKGKATLTPEEMKAYKGMGKIVVATCMGGPISVKEEALKTGEEAEKMLKTAKSR